MFGYVRPCIPELRVREYAAYRAFYCGICKSLGRQCGPLCRAFLQYDFALLAIALDAALPEEAAIAQRRCAVAPWNRLPVAQGEAVCYAADAHGLLLLAKAADDRQDRGAGRFLEGPLRAMTRGAAARRPQLARRASEMIREQREAEWAGASLQQATEPFALFCAEMFTPPFVPQRHKEALRWLGLNIGRWIGIADALDDYLRDKRRGRFNPLRQPTREAAALAALPEMGLCAKEAAAALDILPDRRSAPIARNILEQGLYDVCDALERGDYRRGGLRRDSLGHG